MRRERAGSRHPIGGFAPLLIQYAMKNSFPALACTLALLCGAAQAQDAQTQALIRKNISERLPTFPKIEQITKTPFNHLFEIRVGKDLFYTDAEGNYLLQGDLLDTKNKTNLTQARLDELNVVDFASLPLKDAIVWKQGNGTRKLAVFTDPNCGYCKRLEKDLRNIKDVTIYSFVIPILGSDSVQKSRKAWCAKEGGKAWVDWMIDNKPLPEANAACDSSAIERNLALAKKHGITATPASVFESGKMTLGALDSSEIERLMGAQALKR